MSKQTAISDIQSYLSKFRQYKPKSISGTELRQAGVNMPEDWTVNTSGEDITFVSPGQQEVTFDDIVTTPTTWRTKEEQARYEQQIADNALLYKEYQRTGGVLNYDIWENIGGPVRPDETFEKDYLDTQNLYSEYIRTGGQLDFNMWQVAGKPIRTDQEFSAIDNSLFHIYGQQMNRDEIKAIRTELFADYEANAPELVNFIYNAGRSIYTDNLFRQLQPGLTDEQLDEIWAGVTNSGAMTGSGQYIPENMLKDAWDAFRVGAQGAVRNTGEFFTTVVPSLWNMQPDVQAGEPKVPGLFTSDIYQEAGGVDETMFYTKAEADVINQQNARDRSVIEQRIEKNNAEIQKWYEEHPDLVADPRYEAGPEKYPELWTDAGWYLYQMAGSAAYSLSILAATTATMFLTGNPYLSLAVGTAVATPGQTADLFNDLINAGATPDQAAMSAIPTGVVISSVEAVTDLPLLKAIFPGTSVITNEIKNTVVDLTAKELIKKGLTTFTKVEISETMEEVVQQLLQNKAISIFDSNKDIFEDIDQTVIQALIASAPFAIFGGATSMRHIPSFEANTVTQEQKTAEGWQQDELTGEWFKPDSIENIYTEVYEAQIVNGSTEQEAKLAALNEAARYPEGEQAISQYIDNEMVAEPQPGIDTLMGAVTEQETVRPLPLEKEIWEMTLEEVKDYTERNAAHLGKTLPSAELLEEHHKGNIRFAVSQGFTVPDEVLNQYPDLFEIDNSTPAIRISRQEKLDLQQQYNSIINRLAPPGRLPAGQGTKSELRLEAARLYARINLTNAETVSDIQSLINNVEQELGNRALPYHGRRPNLYPEFNTVQLQEIVNSYQQAIDESVSALPVQDEVTRQLNELYKMMEIWQTKLIAIEQRKKKLAAYIREMVPMTDRGKFLTAVSSVKNERQLQYEMARVKEYAEENAKTKLRVEIRRRLSYARAVIRNGILKGKYTPDVQERIDVLIKHLNDDRDAARELMGENIEKYEDGKITQDEMYAANEEVYFAGINGMTTEELTETLDYLKALVEVGRSERQAKLASEFERTKELRTAFVDIITGGKGVIPTAGRPKDIKENSRLEKLVNWNYGWDDLMDKLSQFDKDSKPYHSTISKATSIVHRATQNQEAGTNDAFITFRRMVEDIYKVSKTKDVNRILNGLQEEVELGTFRHSDEYIELNPHDTYFKLTLTKDQILSKYMQLQDSTLQDTFRVGMGWTDEVIDAVNNSLTGQEKQLAEGIFAFYENYYNSVNEIYKELYGVNLPHNSRYSPSFRDLEGKVTEQVLTYQDARRYASTINGSLKVRRDNIRPLKFNEALKLLANHINQMEHFKAFAIPIRDIRRLFNDAQVREAILQNQGLDVMKKVDTFIEQMARDGVDRATTLHRLDTIRKNFTKSILAVKPVVGLKQIPSLFAYVSEMSVPDFFEGIADYWKNPIKNYRFLRDNSKGFANRVSSGFERDIREAMQTHGIQRLSGKISFLEWFLVQIRLMDTFAVTQGMWAKYQAGLKAGLTTEEALAAAEDTTNRTQPSFGIDTLSSLQNGGSLMKLLTMFQNQPNKYFRLIGNNLRNFKYGRGSQAKAASNIIMAWVIMPMIFQFISDAFQWKPDRQARAAILGPLNYMLIGGQMIQSASGWLTGDGFDYQASPVLSTINDVQNAVTDALQISNQMQDPYSDVSTDDVASMIEFLAKAGGQATGLPTPYFVQLEKLIRTKQGQDLSYKDFLFSQWALEPPAPDAREQVEAARGKLGTIIQEAGPLSDAEPKLYQTNNWLTDIGEVYSKTLPSDLLNATDRDSKAWATYKTAQSNADILPNVSLYEINTEDNGDTIIDYYRQWQAREKIDNLPDLKEFDKLYPKAYMGNVTREQYNLLVKYLEAENKPQFLADHPELKVNPREDYLKQNPTDNAWLSLAGDSKLLTVEAYNAFNDLMDEYDLTDDDIPDMTLPPAGSVENYFEYQTIGNEYGWNSAEALKLLAGDDDLREWLGREPVTTPVEVLDLKIKNREYEDMAASYSDKNSPNYIADKTARELAVQKLRDDNPEWVDDTRRIEALENDGEEYQELWVERGKLIDEHGTQSSEAKLWLIDNPDVHQWALDNEVLSDDGSGWNENVIRINVQYADFDDKYDGYGDRNSEYYLSDPVTRADTRKDLLDNNPAYATVRVQRDFYRLEGPVELMDSYIEYQGLSSKSYLKENYLKEHQDLYEMLTDRDIMGGSVLSEIDFEQVPDKRYDQLYLQYQDLFDKYDGMGNGNSIHYISDPELRSKARQKLLNSNSDFNEARIRRDGYKKFIGADDIETIINAWVGYEQLTKPANWNDEMGTDLWFEDEWYLMEHPELYKEMVSRGYWQEIDFDLVPTKQVFYQYLTYVNLPVGAPRYEYRKEHPKLEDWLVKKFDLKPIGSRGRNSYSDPWRKAADVDAFKSLFD